MSAVFDKLKKYLPSGFAVKTRSELEAQVLKEKSLDNVIGFVGMTGTARTEMLISNLVYLLKDDFQSIGIIDFNMQFPKIYDIFEAEVDDRPHGLFKYFKNTETVPVSEFFYNTSIPNVKVISALHSQSIYEYDEMSDAGLVKEFIKEVRNSFDLVIVNLVPDLYNVPFIIGLQQCDFGYLVLDESLDAIKNYGRVKSTLKAVVDFTKYTKAVLNDVHFTLYDPSGLSEVGLSYLTSVGHDADVIKASYDSQIYFRDGLKENRKVRAAYEILKDDIMNTL